MHCSLAQSLTAEQSLIHSLCYGQSPVHSLTLMYISWSLLAFHEITTYFPPPNYHITAHICKTWTQILSSAKSQSDISCKVTKHLSTISQSFWEYLEHSVKSYY